MREEAPIQTVYAVEYRIRAVRESTCFMLAAFLRRNSIQCKCSRDWLFAIAFFWNTISQVELILLDELDWVNTFQKNAIAKNCRAIFCTEWKSPTRAVFHKAEFCARRGTSHRLCAFVQNLCEQNKKKFRSAPKIQLPWTVTCCCASARVMSQSYPSRS